MTRLALIGDATLATAYSRVNAAWLRGLRAAGYHIVGDAPDVIVHHDYRQHFATCAVPPAPRRIAVRTWDFGPFPRSWTARIGSDFDRLWVHSAWVREKAVESGVDAGLIDVVPHGIDPGVFRPDGPVAGKPGAFTFLFVGAAVVRKGVDILLRAYAKAFDAGDDVRLILKAHSSDVFYQGQQLSDAIAAFEADPRTPPLELIDAFLPDDGLAALYRAADVGVFPYRAEGFAIPILEAMACGLPCIVPRFGACLDYCTHGNAIFVEARRIRLPVGREMAFNSFGFRDRVEAVDFCEVPVDALAAALRAAYDMRDDARRALGAAASRTVHEGWTWNHAVSRLGALLCAVHVQRETVAYPDA
ncbi:MAG: glycosyltransferase family 4 protein [Vicinamibacterales bacterium]